MRYWHCISELLPEEKIKAALQEHLQNIRQQVFDDEAIQAIRDVADKYDIPVELITKLIVSVDTNKHITKNNKMQKAFDSIIGQGWLHYNSVEGALNHED